MAQKITEKDVAKMEEFYASMYFHLAAEYCRTFGEVGENNLRAAVRSFGHDRGSQNRSMHEDKGYPINLHTLFTVSAFPGKSGFKRTLFQLDARRRRSHTLVCALHEVWKKLGADREGIIYCEEIHGAMWSAYDKGIKTVQEKIMTRGDAHCTFDVRFDTPVDTKTYEQEFPVPDHTAQMQAMQDLFCKMFYYLAKGLLDHYGQAGDAAVRRAVRRFGLARGKQLRREHLEKGLEITLENLFNHYDLPGDPRFKRNPIELTRETRLSETLVCPFHDVWKTYERGNEIGRIYCEEVHHQIFGGYDPGVQTNLSRTLTQGDELCRFSVYLRPSNRDEAPQWIQEWESKRTIR